jgi:hypothetical protein
MASIVSAWTRNRNSSPWPAAKRCASGAIPQAEARLIGALVELGFTPVPHHAIYAARPLPRPSYGLASEAAWEDFKSELLPRLRAAGWEVELPPDFRHDYVDIDEWQAEVSEAAPGWFDLSMGIVVEGRRLALAPLLASLFARDAALARPPCPGPCAPTSRKAWPGCSTCANRTWPASWPTTWAWARPPRPWPTC